MSIQLMAVMPVPLQDRFSQRASDVWNKTVTYEDGEWIKIKAPSGTGKTTLVHILYKLRSDYEGNVLWRGQNLHQITGSALARLRQEEVSIIFQDLRLFPQLTARENIELNRVLQQPYCKPERIDEMADRLGITSVLQQKTGLCSYGEQQRIAILRSLVQPFRWLLMDEPFSHLDKNNTEKAAALIAEECRQRQAGFVLTDLDEDNHFAYSKQYVL